MKKEVGPSFVIRSGVLDMAGMLLRSLKDLLQDVREVLTINETDNGGLRVAPREIA
jgi:hypothetical protein